jgi:hypothetical protein
MILSQAHRLTIGSSDSRSYVFGGPGWESMIGIKVALIEGICRGESFRLGY